MTEEFTHPAGELFLSTIITEHRSSVVRDAFSCVRLYVRLYISCQC